MKEYLAIVTAEHAYLRAEAENENGENLSGIEDEIFSGWAVKVLEKLPGKQYLKIETHYGYSGYVKEEEIKPITEEELEKRQDKDRRSSGCTKGAGTSAGAFIEKLYRRASGKRSCSRLE